MLFEFPKIGSAAPALPADPAAIPCLATLRSYWEGLRVHGALPLREAVEPKGLAGALENTFLIERIAAGMGRFRLAGMAVQEVLGIEARNMPMTLLFEPVARAHITRVLDEVFSGREMLDVTLEAERTIGRPALSARMILLPLAEPRGGYCQIIGALALSGAVGRAPRRFGITRMRSEALDVQEDVFVSTPALPSARALMQRLDDFAALPAAHHAARPPARPALRLVHSRD